jgi:hypothetical protein
VLADPGGQDVPFHALAAVDADAQLRVLVLAGLQAGPKNLIPKNPKLNWSKQSSMLDNSPLHDGSTQIDIVWSVRQYACAQPRTGHRGLSCRAACLCSRLQRQYLSRVQRGTHLQVGHDLLRQLCQEPPVDDVVLKFANNTRTCSIKCLMYANMGCSIASWRQALLGCAMLCRSRLLGCAMP